MPTMPTAEETPRQPKPRRWANLIASVALILCIVAWIAMAYDEYTSIGLGIAAMCMAIVGCFTTRRSIWRDIAITAIIASGVLLLVFAMFTFGLDILVKSI